MKCPSCKNEIPPESLFCSNCGAKIEPVAFDPDATMTYQSPHKNLAIGRTFANRYQIIEELGKGGMGTVYKALDKEINEKIAIKVLKPEISFDKNIIERFRNELKVARNISHKNICRMYALERERLMYFIIMEYVSGEDLKNTITRVGRLSVGKTLIVAEQLCLGLSEAHRSGIVHRDIKLQNIMIDSFGEVRIMDFGIAHSKKANGITDTGMMIGTPEYMSPEQTMGEKIDLRSDIYSLGVVLFELLTGKLPFEGDTSVGVALKHKTETPPNPRELNDQIPVELSRVILKCLEKEKENRYKSADELLVELQKIKKGVPTTQTAVPGKKPEVIKTQRRIPPFAVILGSVFFAAVLLVGGFLLINHLQKPEQTEMTNNTAGVIKKSVRSEEQSAEPEDPSPTEEETQAQASELIDQPLDQPPPKKEITPPADKPVSSVSQYGLLNIRSQPAGARIYLDNQDVGQTPLEHRLKPGSYKMRISKSPEYKEISVDLNITTGTTFTKSYALSPVYKLKITSNPSGAEVKINGTLKGTTPLNIEVQKKSCRLLIQKGDEWSFVYEQLTLKPGINNIKRTLPRKQIVLSVNTTPSGAKTFLNGNLMGESPLKKNIRPGRKQRLKIEKDGYAPVEETLNLLSNTEKSFTLKRLSPGKIRFKVNPFAKVFVNGAYIGDVPPVKTIEYKQGEYNILFTSADMEKVFSVKVEIKSGEMKEVSMNMASGKSKVITVDEKK